MNNNDILKWIYIGFIFIFFVGFYFLITYLLRIKNELNVFFSGALMYWLLYLFIIVLFLTITQTTTTIINITQNH
jgi:hypothetical protein